MKERWISEKGMIATADFMNLCFELAVDNYESGMLIDKQGDSHHKVWNEYARLMNHHGFKEVKDDE